MVAQGVARKQAAVHQSAHGQSRSQPCAGDAGAARAAVRLQYIAVQMQGAFAQRLEIEHGPQAAPDQALDFLGAAALLAPRGLAVRTRVGGARQHAVLGGDPALPPALEKRRHFVEHAGIAQNMGIAHLDQYGPFGMARIAGFEQDRTQLVGQAARRPLSGAGRQESS